MAIQTSPIRLGVIGCGNVLSAYRMAIDKLRVHGLVETVIACGRESQRASACTALGITRFTPDAMEVIDSPDVDLVVILTSMPEHAHLATVALKAGKHVLVEKPLATSLQDARAVVASPTSTG